MATYREMFPYVKECMTKDWSITLDQSINGTDEDRREFLTKQCVELYKKLYEIEEPEKAMVVWYKEYDRLIGDTYIAYRQHDGVEDLPREVYNAVDEFWYGFIYLSGVDKAFVPSREELGI